MIEIKLVAISFSVQPLEEPEESKQINFFHQPTQTAYLVPFSKDAIDTLVADLTLSNKDLSEKIDKQNQQREIEIAQSVPEVGPNGEIDLSNLRGD